MPKTFRGSFDQAVKPQPSVVKEDLAAAAREPTLQPMLSTVQRLSLSLLIFCVLSGTCQCFFWHRFPAGVSCVTAIRPRQPSNAPTLRSGLTHSIVEAFGRLPAFRRVLSAPALHILSLGVHECRLPAFRPLFKPLNPPQRLYTLSCWGFQTTVC